jgi:hypothetical protein
MHAATINEPAPAATEGIRRLVVASNASFLTVAFAGGDCLYYQLATAATIEV